MKRALLIILSFITMFLCTVDCTGGSVPASYAEEAAPALNARHAIVIEKSSDRVLFEKAAYEKTAMASTTKLMTALVVAESIDMDAITTVSKRAASIGGSVAELRYGEEITIKDLMYCLLLRSGNDAAIALAEAVGGSIDDFCRLMNKKAKKLGAYNTNFTSPHGLDNENHYTTASDLAIICKAASENTAVNEIMATKHYTFGKRFLINTNPFLGVLDGVLGGKTGFTNNAGRCIAMTASRSGMEVIIVLIGCTDSKARFSDGKKLTEYVYSNYSSVEVIKKNTIAAIAQNKKNIFSDAEIRTTSDITLPLKSDELQKLRFKFEFDGTVHDYRNTTLVLKTNNEFKEGSIVGNIDVFTEDNKKLATTECIIVTPIVEKDFLYYFKKIVVCWFCGVV